MELRQLNYFKEAADTLSFTKAAQRCHVTQSTLGQQIRQIEQELGCELFERNAGGLELTESGKQLLVTARRVLSEVACAVSTIRDGQDGAGHTLRIGYYGTALASHLGHILHDCHSRHPDIWFEVTEAGPDDLTRRVLDGDLDCAFTVFDPDRHDLCELRCEQIHACPYIALVSRGSVAAPPWSTVSVADIPAPIVTLSRIQSVRLTSQLVGDDPSNEKRVEAPVNTHRALLLLVASGQCSALAPEDTWVEAAGVDAYRLSDLSLGFRTCLIRRIDCANPAVNALRNICKVWFAKKEEGGSGDDR